MLQEIQIRLPHLTLAATANFASINPASTTLIFLHGYLDNADSFATLIPCLSEYQCVAIDMAGHGKSEHRSADAHYHLSDYAYDIYQVIATLRLTQFVLVGHSLGAIVCSLYASTQPQGLKGFIAIESCGPLSLPASTAAAQLSECFTSRAQANKAIKHPLSMEAVVRSRCAVSDLSDDYARQIVSRNLSTDTQGKLQWRTDKRLRTKSALRMTPQQSNAVLNSIHCPRVLILGNQGFEKVKTAVREQQTAFLGVLVFTFAGGHHVHLDSTAEVANCIVNFAAQCCKP